MGSRRRSVMLVVAVVLVAVVVVGAVVVMVVGLPVVVAAGVALLALVAGVGSRVVGRPRRRRGRPRSSPPRPGAQVGPVGPQWTTRWEGRPTADAVPLARGRLSAELEEWGLIGETRDDVLLVATELLSNAVLHGDGPVRLAVGLRDGSVRVEVHDTAAAAPRPVSPHRSNGCGRGLQVVEALSADWGWTALSTGGGPDGKVVWADVPDRRTSRTGTDHPDDR